MTFTTSILFASALIALTQNPALANTIKETRHEPQNAGWLAADERVVHGYDATPGQFPYQVAMIINGDLLCGSSLVSPTIILTAAHCLFFSGRTVEVHLGAHNIYDPTEVGRVVISSSDTHVHEGFNPLTMSNDIAFVRLSEPVTLSATIAVVRLPRRSQETETFESAVAIISGWGVTNSSSSTISPILRYGETTVLRNDVCALSYQEGRIQDFMLCALELTGAPCNSDSGSPLATTESDGVATLIGIVSFGRGISCENMDPGVYTRITSFLDWIETNTGIVIQP